MIAAGVSAPVAPTAFPDVAIAVADIVGRPAR
jgi:hypothetical protein